MRLQFDLEWRITLATLVLLPILVNLGFWQLQRAEDKARLQSEWAERQSAAPVPLTVLADQAPEQWVYRGVRLTGEFLIDRYLLLDNRVRQGRFGYEVVGLLALKQGGVALVNRGWLPGDPARRELPVIDWPRGEVSLIGHLYRSPGEPYLLGKQDFFGRWPLVVQALQVGPLAERLRTEFPGGLFPLEVRLKAGEPGALFVDWQIVNVSPEKHQAYAVQWFTMATFLVLLWWLRNSNLWSLIRNRRTS